MIFTIIYIYYIYIYIYIHRSFKSLNKLGIAGRPAGSTKAVPSLIVWNVPDLQGDSSFKWIQLWQHSGTFSLLECESF